MSYLFSNIEVNSHLLRKLPFDLIQRKTGNFHILLQDDSEIVENDKFVGLIEGYLRNVNFEKASNFDHSVSAFNEMECQWPLSENFTGSFSTTILLKNGSEIIIGTDLIGLYPLYYLKNSRGFFLSNSIILIAGVSQVEKDEIGVLQRAIGQDYSNIGSRTILKGCKRLLPGESMKFNESGKILSRKYDNTLYSNLSSSILKKPDLENYWKTYQTEVELCLNQRKDVNIALSGGMDSRVVLGAVPASKKIKCLTFGAKDNYETKIAARLAAKRKTTFQSFYDPKLYFPSDTKLKEYTLYTEAVQNCTWLEILENVQPKQKEPLLLGELCEALPGRNIKMFSSRSFRENNFLKYFIRKESYPFTKATEQNFTAWKKKTLERYLIYYDQRRIDRLDVNVAFSEVQAAVKEDLEEIFLRIEAHQLPFSELYDELLSWYTFSRMVLSKQLLITKSKFDAYSPAMSLKVLRATSNIHPNLRLNYRFANKLFKKVPELNLFNSIPTNQAPLLPFNAPDVLKFLIWGLRSKIDSYLIKRLIKARNPNLRYRLFKSINWVYVYQNPDVENNLRAYFKRNNLGEEYFLFILKQCQERKELKSWPFANFEIINAASLNAELEIIKENKS